MIDIAYGFQLLDALVCFDSYADAVAARPPDTPLLLIVNGVPTTDLPEVFNRTVIAEGCVLRSSVMLGEELGRPLPDEAPMLLVDHDHGLVGIA